MAESAKKDKASQKTKTSWFKGLKSEFNKISWLDNRTVGRQTVAVVCITAVLAILISVLDSAVVQVLNLLIK